MKIKWKQVPEYPEYEVSSAGGFRKKLKSGYRDLATPISTWQYPVAYFQSGSKRTARLVHRLVAALFMLPPPTPAHEINHKNGVKADNRVENLEWVTRSENMKHAFALGLAVPDERHGMRAHNRKLHYEDVQVIRELRSWGLSSLFLGEMFQISHGAVRAICLRRTWKDY